MAPLWTRSAPSHSAATVEALSTSITIGNMNAISRPACSAVSVTWSLAPAKRSVSYGSRTKARTTRMPVICSRRTRLTSSMRSCINRNCGTIRHTTSPMLTTSTGTLTSSSPESATSSRSAMTTPPTIVIGAATSSVQVMRTRSCTCCTSLVIRVISDGAPKPPTSRAEKSVTRWNRSRRTSRPKPMAVRAP